MTDEEQDTSISQDEIKRIYDYAESIIAGTEEDKQDFAPLLIRVLAPILYRAQAKEINEEQPLSGPGVDEWEEQNIGQHMKVAGTKSASTLKQLRKQGFFDDK